MTHKQIIYLGSGRTRAIYRHGNFVIKVPLNDEGIIGNNREHSTFRNRKSNDPIQYARCRLIKDSTILVMEYVEPAYENLPKWSEWVDCQQVGKNRKGEVVAYDYG